MTGAAPPGSEDDDATADAQRWGISLDDSWTRPSGDGGLWARHLPAFLAFSTVGTQWRVAAGMNGFAHIGLDYGGVKAGLDLAGITLTPGEWDDLRDIEAGALEALNGSRA